MPELRLLEMLRSLDDAEIEFLVFGAVALAFYGHVRATADLDVVIRPEERNRGRVIAWLHDHDARLALNPERAFGADEAESVRRGSNATLLTDLGQLDIVQHLPGLAPWSQLDARAEEYAFEGLRLKTIDRATLKARKRARGTPQDLADVAVLDQLESDSGP
jgi:hypothetical protein